MRRWRKGRRRRKTTNTRNTRTRKRILKFGVVLFLRWNNGYDDMYYARQIYPSRMHSSVIIYDHFSIMLKS